MPREAVYTTGECVSLLKRATRESVLHPCNSRDPEVPLARSTGSANRHFPGVMLRRRQDEGFGPVMARQRCTPTLHTEFLYSP